MTDKEFQKFPVFTSGIAGTSSRGEQDYLSGSGRFNFKDLRAEIEITITDRVDQNRSRTCRQIWYSTIGKKCTGPSES